MNITYPSGLSNTEWDCLQQYLRASQSNCRTRRHSLRSMLNAIFYVLRTGCPWRYLPSSFPPWQTVFYHFHRFRLHGRWTVLFTALPDKERQRVGRDPHPSTAIMDAQSVKTVEGSAHTSGFAAHKRVKGRKRRLLVDALGITLFYCVTPADLHDTQGARRLLAGLRYFVPRLKTIWADSAYRGKDLAEWCKALGNWDIAVVDRTPARADSPFTGALIDWVARQYWITLDVVYPALRQLKRYSPDLLPDLGYEPGGFQVIPKRWIVERTFSWLGRQRRLSKDYERLPSTAEAFIYLVGIRLLLARLTRR